MSEFPRPPRLIPDGVYSEQDIIHNLQIGPDKFRSWRGREINPLIPLHRGKQFYYLGADVIEFLKSLRDE